MATIKNMPVTKVKVGDDVDGLPSSRVTRVHTDGTDVVITLNNGNSYHYDRSDRVGVHRH